MVRKSERLSAKAKAAISKIHVPTKVAAIRALKAGKGNTRFIALHKIEVEKYKATHGGKKPAGKKAVDEYKKIGKRAGAAYHRRS